MRKYSKLYVKMVRMQTVDSILEMSIHREVGYPEDAANVGLF